jgi:transcriptional regulator with XRE-family HTH domain
MPEINLIAQNTKRLIKKKGLLQYFVARQAGFSPGQFSNMMNGRKIISAEDIVKIAEALGVTPNELFEDSSQTKIV